MVNISFLLFFEEIIPLTNVQNINLNEYDPHKLASLSICLHAKNNILNFFHLHFDKYCTFIQMF